MVVGNEAARPLDSTYHVTSQGIATVIIANTAIAIYTSIKERVTDFLAFHIFINSFKTKYLYFKYTPKQADCKYWGFMLLCN